LPDPLKIISIQARTASSAVLFVEAVILVDKPRRRLTEGQAASLLASHPTLAEHACRQHGVGRFGERLAEASLPHLAEHLAIDLLVAKAGQQVSGATTATLVRLRLTDGLATDAGAAAAEAALRAAVAELNALLST
jgi:hypothetical protein